MVPTLNTSVRPLQWGRAPESAETDYVKARTPGFVGLQWGRAPESAETEDLLFVSKVSLASMGPRS